MHHKFAFQERNDEEVCQLGQCLLNGLFFCTMLDRPCSSFKSSTLRFIVALNFVDVRIYQKIFPNKAFWNNGMIWEKIAVVGAFEEEIHQQSPSWKVARNPNLI